MYAPLTAFEVLLGCIVVAFVGALFGFLGGMGGTLMLRVQVARLSGVIASVVNSGRGANGAAVAAAVRERTSKADKEAEALAARLVQAQRAAPPRRIGSVPPSGAFEEEQALEALEAEAARRGLKAKGGES